MSGFFCISGTIHRCSDDQPIEAPPLESAAPVPLLRLAALNWTAAHRCSPPGATSAPSDAVFKSIDNRNYRRSGCTVVPPPGSIDGSSPVIISIARGRPVRASVPMLQVLDFTNVIKVPCACFKTISSPTWGSGRPCGQGIPTSVAVLISILYSMGVVFIAMCGPQILYRNGKVTRQR